ncbi:SDR family oxidoreductase [Streptomyces sp. NPDC029216]|uniref:SDR family NAD(P)-dependent oxidoreductase n=1 Tax=Streptomyces sp. NPDC029216 TaxID=3154701 RepID=UPI0033D97EE3
MTRTVVVSGGGTGIGRAVCAAFAAEGARVIAVGRRKDVLERTAAELTERHEGSGGRVLALDADLALPEEADRVRDEVLALGGPVDVLVNAAGGDVLIGVPDEVAAGTSGAAWHWTENFRSNVLSAVLLTEALHPVITSPGGRIVMISSIAAYRGSGAGSYAGAKAALHPYVYDLAAALGPRGVTVNAVAPGYIEQTEFFGADGLGADRHELLVGQTHTGRAGVPDDIAGTVAWLASPAASQVTAQIIQVNGGAERGR